MTPIIIIGNLSKFPMLFAQPSLVVPSHQGDVTLFSHYLQLQLLEPIKLHIIVQINLLCGGGREEEEQIERNKTH